MTALVAFSVSVLLMVLLTIQLLPSERFDEGQAIEKITEVASGAIADALTDPNVSALTGDAEEIENKIEPLVQKRSEEAGVDVVVSELTAQIAADIAAVDDKGASAVVDFLELSAVQTSPQVESVAQDIAERTLATLDAAGPVAVANEEVIGDAALKAAREVVDVAIVEALGAEPDPDTESVIEFTLAQALVREIQVVALKAPADTALTAFENLDENEQDDVSAGSVSEPLIANPQEALLISFEALGAVSTLAIAFESVLSSFGRLLPSGVTTINANVRVETAGTARSGRMTLTWLVLAMLAVGLLARRVVALWVRR